MRGLTLLLLPIAAAAPARNVYVSSFDRIRVEGPIQVTLTTGRSPAGTVTGDARAVEEVEVRQDGAVLIVRVVARDERGRSAPLRDDKPPRLVTLATPALASATVVGGGQLAIVGDRAARLDLSVTGPGAIVLTGAQVDQVNATVIGTGAITAAGRATRARLLVNGAGTIAADKLEAGELVARLDGPGELNARARYTANVTNTGLGRVSVAGTAKCEVRSSAGGAVVCGAGR